MQGSWVGGLAIRHKSSRDNVSTRLEVSTRNIRQGENFRQRCYSLTSAVNNSRSSILPLAVWYRASWASYPPWTAVLSVADLVCGTGGPQPRRCGRMPHRLVDTIAEMGDRKQPS